MNENLFERHRKMNNVAAIDVSKPEDKVRVFSLNMLRLSGDFITRHRERHNTYQAVETSIDNGRVTGIFSGAGGCFLELNSLINPKYKQISFYDITPDRRKHLPSKTELELILQNYRQINHSLRTMGCGAFCIQEQNVESYWYYKCPHDTAHRRLLTVRSCSHYPNEENLDIFPSPITEFSHPDFNLPEDIVLAHQYEVEPLRILQQIDDTFYYVLPVRCKINLSYAENPRYNGKIYQKDEMLIVENPEDGYWNEKHQEIILMARAIFKKINGYYVGIKTESFEIVM